MHSQLARLSEVGFDLPILQDQMPKPVAVGASGFFYTEGETLRIRVIQTAPHRVWIGTVLRR